MQLTGAEIIIECLKEQGVDTVFGYPGGAILNVYDELYKHSGEIRHILTSHEQGASHAADGYARSTGKVGVCFATSGPGATNLVTGIATAYMDSVPLIAITCNVSLPLLGKDSFQEVDIAGITTPITKHNFIVKEVGKLADTIRRAFLIAKRGRPGPVLIDVPKDVTAKKTDFKPRKPEIPEPVESTIRTADLGEAFSMVLNAKKPVMFVGGGAVISRATEELLELSEILDCPVCDSLMGKGAFPGTDKRYTGMLGMHGTKTSNLLVSECDLLIALGTRFSDRVLGNPKSFAKHAKILQIDVDPAEINKNIRVTAEVIGDLKCVLKRLLALLRESKTKPAEHAEWMQKAYAMKEEFPLSYPKEGLSGPYMIERVYEKTKGDAIVCTEVGQHQMWTAQYYPFTRPGQLITSGGAGTMGYGLGAAIGAKIGNPDKTVVNFAGDGCFRMNLNELMTAKRNGLNVIEIIVNNHVLGMVRQWQDLFYEKHYSATVLDDGADFVKIAEGCGAKGIRVKTREEFDRAFDEALKEDGPVVLDCIIGCDDKVWPMVAPGESISNIMENEEDVKK